MTSTTHTVFLTTPEQQRIGLQVEKREKGRYALTGAVGFASLDGRILCFDLEASGPEVRNLDFSSDSFSCFGLSEALQVPGLAFQYVEDAPMFQAANLRQLQSGLNRLRGNLIASDEF
jgi:hypothetical protein